MACRSTSNPNPSRHPSPNPNPSPSREQVDVLLLDPAAFIGNDLPHEPEPGPA